MTFNLQIVMPFTALNLKSVASDRIAERRQEVQATLYVLT